MQIQIKFLDKNDKSIRLRLKYSNYNKNKRMSIFFPQNSIIVWWCEKKNGTDSKNSNKLTIPTILMSCTLNWNYFKVKNVKANESFSFGFAFL